MDSRKVMFSGYHIEPKIVDIEVKLPSLSDLCPHCYGSGKQKAMQMGMTYDAGTIRANDTKVKCEHCKGTGIKK